MPRAFERLATEIVHDSPWIRVMRHRIADREGAPTDHVVLTFGSPDWVNVVARTDAGELVLVRQHRFGIDAESLEIPGGLIDPGEDPERAARRELLEETGYMPRTLRSLGWVHPNPALHDNRLHTFLAEGCRRVEGQRLDEFENCRVELVPESDFVARIARGEVTHALVQTALYRASLLFPLGR